MSLPPAQKVRSENPGACCNVRLIAPGSTHDPPGKNTVAAPSDPEAIEQDVARKLRIYAMVQALRRGRLPSNGQLDDALVVLRDKLTQRTSKAESKENTIPLSDEGRTVVLDVRDIVETVRHSTLLVCCIAHARRIVEPSTSKTKEHGRGPSRPHLPYIRYPPLGARSRSRVACLYR
jgi:hypothetical protein